jgi:hypothetical protein
MRIPASVLKGIRVGLSGTSLALAVGCTSQPSSTDALNEPITREATELSPAQPGTAVAPRDSVQRPPQDTVVRRAETAPPPSPFLVDSSAAQSQPMEFGELNEPASVTRRQEAFPRVEATTRVQPIATPPVGNGRVGNGRNEGWRRAAACGRG